LSGQSNDACDFDSAIAAGESNSIGYEGSAFWNFIGAGTYNAILAENSFVGSGTNNIAQSDYAFVGAGTFDSAEGPGSFVGAGDYVYYVRTGFGNATAYGNIASGADSFVGSGDLNQVTGNGSFIGAGDYTYGNGSATTVGNQVSGVDSFLGAGDQNSVAADDAFAGSGNLNSVASGANDSVLVGGYGNVMSGQKAALGGGEANEVAGSFAVVPGGYHDEALGPESFAAGSQAEARHTGSFVWSDYASGEKAQTDSAPGEFVARASGGVYFFSNAASSAGVHLAAGSGTWSSLSDRNAKTDVVPLDDASILSKVASLPVSAWRYKSENGVRHIGPMAQDFYAAFGVGEDDRHITSIDEDGVALAAIKALRRENSTLHVQDERKSAEIAALRREMESVETRLAALETRRK
jgi:hypothetical protein